jgi:hypothetical protein
MDSTTKQAIFQEATLDGSSDGTTTVTYQEYMRQRRARFEAVIGYKVRDTELLDWMIYHAEKDD